MAHRNEDRGGISYAPGHQMPNFGPDRQRTSRRMDPDRITAEGLELLKFPRRLALVAERHLAATRRDDSDVYNVELATLQRMVIHDLQRQLLQLVGRIHDEQTADAQKMEDAKKLLEDYCELRGFPVLLCVFGSPLASRRSRRFEASYSASCRTSPSCLSR